MQGLYVHIPFCVRKCRYCDFISFCGMADVHGDYIDVLGREMAQYAGSAIDTVFIGGGTPTVLEPAHLEKLLGLIGENFCLQPDTEFTIEANPKTLTKEKLAILRAGGVNRLSIGVQSFCDEELKMLGRIHSARDAYNTVQMAQDAGFSNINLDLMSALPEQTPEKFRYSLGQAVGLAPTHISCYSLILEEGTPLAKAYAAGEFRIPDEDTDRAMYELACAYLQEHGFGQYEISNFAKPGFACRHNLKYWECQPYIGIGVAAHGFDGALRRANTESLTEYLAGHGIGRIEDRLTVEDQMSEFMILGLRKIEGVSETEFFKRFQTSVDDVFGKTIQKFTAGGFLCREGGRVFLSRTGISVSNGVMCEFILK